MSQKTEVFENVYVRAVLISGDNIETVNGSSSIFERSLIDKAKVARGKAAFGVIEVEAKLEPQTEQVRRVTTRTGRGRYVYRVYVADVMVEDAWYLLIGVPMKELIPVVLPDTPVKYAVCDLRKLLNDQFQRLDETQVAMSRLNAKLYGDDEVESIALYGNRIMKGRVVKDILGETLAEDIGGPFLPQTSELRIDPNSCRLVWNDGEPKVEGLNVDSVGNYSFFLRSVTSIKKLMSIFAYVASIKGFEITSANPLKRSVKALESVAK